VIDLSLGEFEALVAKAMRGAGYSWGLTEDGAHALRRLAEFGLPAAELAVTLLRAVEPIEITEVMPTPDWLVPRDWLCPVCVGAAVADRRSCPDAEIGPVLLPAVVGPIAASTFGESDTGGYALSWDGGTLEVTAAGIVATGDLMPASTLVTIRRDEHLVVHPQARRRINLSSTNLGELERFAGRTYAPATEASRAGAGAAESDND